MPANVINLHDHRPPSTGPDRPGRPVEQDTTPTAVEIPAGRLVYTVAEVSALLSISLGGTYALVRSGDIPARKLGGRWVIPIRAFEDWLNACAQLPDPSAGRGPLPGQDGLF